MLKKQEEIENDLNSQMPEEEIEAYWMEQEPEDLEEVEYSWEEEEDGSERAPGKGDARKLQTFSPSGDTGAMSSVTSPGSGVDGDF